MAMEKFPETTEILATENGDVFVSRTSPNETITRRKSALLMHGLGDHSGRHEHARLWLTEQGYEVLRFDWPGSGLSQGARGDLISIPFCLELIDTIRQLASYPLGCLYAHSTGGLILLRWLQSSHHELELIWLSSPLLDPSFNQPWGKITAGKLLAPKLPNLCIPTGVKASDCFTTGKENTVGDASLCHKQVSLRFAKSLLDNAISDDFLSNFHWPLNTKVFLSQGLRDKVCPSSLTSKLYLTIPKHLRYALWLADGYHEPFHEVGTSVRPPIRCLPPLTDPMT